MAKMQKFRCYITDIKTLNKIAEICCEKFKKFDYKNWRFRCRDLKAKTCTDSSNLI